MHDPKYLTRLDANNGFKTVNGKEACTTVDDIDGGDIIASVRFQNRKR